MYQPVLVGRMVVSVVLRVCVVCVCSSARLHHCVISSTEAPVFPSVRLFVGVVPRQWSRSRAKRMLFQVLSRWTVATGPRARMLARCETMSKAGSDVLDASNLM